MRCAMVSSGQNCTSGFGSRRVCAKATAASASRHVPRRRICVVVAMRSRSGLVSGRALGFALRGVVLLHAAGEMTFAFLEDGVAEAGAEIVGQLVDLVV